eukprot:CAMPEP_0204350706 /NCGR_PEP_ID=MMETSP0469-20131031/30554_1 /ASSEMBLY_ACC=CAM_ASM_000384 /TAXON_ID=2969 /ORGANISM="Oxyrrhis marina" /LENGTH=194 /DNA_ID=CAMNT_0051337109 /DNA_START=1 /DNA_END=585 /DNA_ORIENTATION=+
MSTLEERIAALNAAPPAAAAAPSFDDDLAKRLAALSDGPGPSGGPGLEDRLKALGAGSGQEAQDAELVAQILREAGAEEINPLDVLGAGPVKDSPGSPASSASSKSSEPKSSEPSEDSATSPATVGLAARSGAAAGRAAPAGSASAPVSHDKALREAEELLAKVEAEMGANNLNDPDDFSVHPTGKKKKKCVCQ